MVQTSIYIGLVLEDQLMNQRRYEAVLNEVLQFLTTRTAEVHIK
jgi:hypothetical protein